MSAKQRPLRFDTERLKHGPISVQTDETPVVFELEDDPEYRFADPIKLDIVLRLVGSNVLLTGEVSTVAENACARCLEQIRIPLRAKLTLVYMDDERLRDPEKYPELVDDNSYYYNGEAIFPMEQIRELLLLELPTVPACELEPGDICPVRNVKIEPMIYGPVKEFEEELQERKAEEGTLAAQLKKLRNKEG